MNRELKRQRRVARAERRYRKQALHRIRVELGKSQRAETGALIASIVSGIIAFTAIYLYVTHAMKDWLDPVILFSVCGGIVASPSIIAFMIGYSQLPPLITADRFERLVAQARMGRSSTSRSHDDDEDLPKAWIIVRQIVTTVALAAVYGYTIFLLTFVILYVFNDFIGFDPEHKYLVVSVVFMALATSYFSYVTGATLTAKHLSLLLPLFVIAGVGVAGVITPYQHWWTNNFSELGDNTTPAARLFNTTLIIAGICVIIISYFAVYELITSRQQYLRWSEQLEDLPADSSARLVLAEHVKNDHILHIRHFRGRTITLLVLLISSGVLLAGVGMFPYSSHTILHNICGRGMTLPIGIMMIGMPWFAPEFSPVFFIAGYLMAIACSVSLILWMKGVFALVVVEELLWILYLLWFILFTRQAAALAQDRRDDQLLYDAVGFRMPQGASPLEISPTIAIPQGQRASMREAARTGTSWTSLNGWSDVDRSGKRS